MCLLFMGSLFAQERDCSTMENLEYRKSINPNLSRNMAEIEAFTEAKLAEMEHGRIDGNIITLPVVVHVLYRNATENISIAQIQSQLDVLNDDFRRTNPDADNVWSQAADTQIQFCLVTVDPNGNATSGITRKQVTRRDWGTSDDMKRTSTGGVNPWNTSEYLNMWVVPQMLNAQGGTILGYAQFPGGSAATDGVVMGYNYFGNTGAVSAPFDGGRTTTHEVGHFLNLRHIWGDSNCGNDFVSDTPTHQTSNSGCPAGRTSCGSVDMYQNYMDYSNDVCMNLFTQGQTNRMRAVLAAGGFRRSLALSDKCGAVAQPTCTDGVQNGDETGVDCGGSSCTPCQAQYCVSNGQSTNDEYISRVQLGTINNASGVGSTSTGYSNFTNVSGSISKNTSSTISITPTWTGTQYNEGYAVFIDYNQDSDFSDAGETVYTRAASQTSPVVGSFTVPNSALNGATRMRVSMKYNGVPTACESFQYGEVEDYTVNIIAGVADTTKPVITINGSSNVTLTVGDAYSDAGATATDNIDGNLTSSIVTTGSVNTNSAGTYLIRYNVSDAAGNAADQKTRTVTVNAAPTSGCSGMVSSFPYSQGFEGGLGDWSQSAADDINWTVDANGTPSGNTGPSSATQGSNYIFVEASGNGTGYPNKRAILNSPCFDLSGQSNATFSFAYHMYGATNMGSISLEVSTNNGSNWSSIWSQTGNKGNQWNTADVDLSAYANSSIQLRFNRVTGNTWQADIAVDDISLTTGSADKCAGVAPWSSGTVYSVGDQVTYQGNLFERTASSWVNLGPCGTARVDGDLTAQIPGTVEISLYPNPVKGNRIYVKSNIQGLAYSVFNTLGQKVAQGISNANGINVSTLNAGLYLVQFEVNNTIETRKFFKQ